MRFSCKQIIFHIFHIKMYIVIYIAITNLQFYNLISANKNIIYLKFEMPINRIQHARIFSSRKIEFAILYTKKLKLSLDNIPIIQLFLYVPVNFKF